MDHQATELQSAQFENYISLGYFCSISLELEQYGLRSFSAPFDWCKSSFQGVLAAIENGFQDFTDPALLAQGEKFRERYYNTKYGIWFFHDFDKYKPLEEQIPEVKQKYDRRIKRFYESIKSPTLFIRYISDEQKTPEGKSAELQWIEENCSRIEELLKSFNPHNEILYIANEGVDSDQIRIFHVAKDENDVVNRKPFSANKELEKIFTSVSFNREENLQFQQNKQKKKKSQKLAKALQSRWKKLFRKEYVHGTVMHEGSL